MKTDKIIRAKMYNWIMARGVFLTHKDLKEIKAIMNEYKSYFLFQHVKKKIKKDVWYPYS